MKLTILIFFYCFISVRCMFNELSAKFLAFKTRFNRLPIIQNSRPIRITSFAFYSDHLKQFRMIHMNCVKNRWWHTIDEHDESIRIHFEIRKQCSVSNNEWYLRNIFFRAIYYTAACQFCVKTAKSLTGMPVLHDTMMRDTFILTSNPIRTTNKLLRLITSCTEAQRQRCCSYNLKALAICSLQTVLL